MIEFSWENLHSKKVLGQGNFNWAMNYNVVWGPIVGCIEQVVKEVLRETKGRIIIYTRKIGVGI